MDEAMESKPVRFQVIALFLLILANFIAQVPYFLHLYYKPDMNLLAEARPFLIMGIVFAVFLVASILLFKRTVAGYWLMLVFLAVEFLFYLWNTIGEVVHGYGLFFHLQNPDLLLKTVFAIGYINLFASGYFLCLLLWKRTDFLDHGMHEALIGGNPLS
ncbi:MAG TPA: hypothetical protein VFQ36_07920 [Ktedonobacteraceae bacterium]|nr:hypothetical protein [Ktedonobacteraceae bacterium]